MSRFKDCGSWMKEDDETRVLTQSESYFDLYTNKPPALFFITYNIFYKNIQC